MLRIVDEQLSGTNGLVLRLFGKAVHILADGCRKWQPQFKTGLEKTTDEKEKGLILGSSEYCDQIIEASAKVPKEVKKKKT